MCRPSATPPSGAKNFSISTPAISPSAISTASSATPTPPIPGDYDGDLAGALTYSRRHMQHGVPEAIANHYLIIGPWDHAGTRTPKPEVGGLKFGPASVLDLNDLHRQWYDWTMKSGAKPDFLKKRVAYNVTGAEEWKYADTLEAVAPQRRVLYLDSDATASDAFRSGSLSTDKPHGAASDHYVYDPLDIRFGQLESQ